MPLYTFEIEEVIEVRRTANVTVLAKDEKSAKKRIEREYEDHQFETLDWDDEDGDVERVHFTCTDVDDTKHTTEGADVIALIPEDDIVVKEYTETFTTLSGERQEVTLWRAVLSNDDLRRAVGILPEPIDDDVYAGCGLATRPASPIAA